MPGLLKVDQILTQYPQVAAIVNDTVDVGQVKDEKYYIKAGIYNAIAVAERDKAIQEALAKQQKPQREDAPKASTKAAYVPNQDKPTVTTAPIVNAAKKAEEQQAQLQAEELIRQLKSLEKEIIEDTQELDRLAGEQLECIEEILAIENKTADTAADSIAVGSTVAGSTIAAKSAELPKFMAKTADIFSPAEAIIALDPAMYAKPAEASFVAPAVQQQAVNQPTAPSVIAPTTPAPAIANQQPAQAQPTSQAPRPAPNSRKKAKEESNPYRRIINSVEQFDKRNERVRARADLYHALFGKLTVVATVTPVSMPETNLNMLKLVLITGSSKDVFDLLSQETKNTFNEKMQQFDRQPSFGSRY